MKTHKQRIAKRKHRRKQRRRIKKLCLLHELREREKEGNKI